MYSSMYQLGIQTERKESRAEGGNVQIYTRAPGEGARDGADPTLQRRRPGSNLIEAGEGRKERWGLRRWPYPCVLPLLARAFDASFFLAPLALVGAVRRQRRAARGAGGS